MEAHNRILIVDDQQDLAVHISRLLEDIGKENETVSLMGNIRSRLGLQKKESKPTILSTLRDSFQVDIATSGEMAKDLVTHARDDESPYSLIFLDMRMPGWDGLETLEQLWMIDDRIQVVICSAYSDHSWEDIVNRVGIHDNLFILKKPFEPAEFYQLTIGLVEKYTIMMENLEKMQLIKKSSSKLLAANNLLANVLETVSSAIISVNRDGVVFNWNAGSSHFCGISSESAIGKHVWDVIPELLLFRDLLETIIKDNVGHGPIHFTGNTYDERRDYNLFIYPLQTVNGSEGAVIRIDDTTESVLKDERLLQAQKMESVGNLAAGIAHNFNNVIGGIQSLGDCIKLTLDTAKSTHSTVELKEEINDDLELIRELTAQGARVVEQLMSLSKKKKTTLEMVNLNELMDRVVSICKNTFTSNIEIEYTPFVENAEVNAYPSLLEQIVLNLCVNAQHAMTIMRPKGEAQQGVLKIALEKIYVGDKMCSIIPESKPGDYWLISVADNGVGMDDNTKNQIFEPYFTTKGSSGTGLGLAMVYGMVNKNNGFLDIYSAVGEGTTFYVFIPCNGVLEIN